MVGQYSHALDFARLDAGTSFVAWRQAYMSMDIGETAAAVATLKPLTPDFVEAQLGSECLQHPHSPLLPNLSERAESLFAADSPNADPENLYVDARAQAVCRQDVAALRMLRRAVEGGYCAYTILGTDPLFVHLRSTREFGEIRRLAAECQARFSRHREERSHARRD